MLRWGSHRLATRWRGRGQLEQCQRGLSWDNGGEPGDSREPSPGQLTVSRGKWASLGRKGGLDPGSRCSYRELRARWQPRSLGLLVGTMGTVHVDSDGLFVLPVAAPGEGSR